MTSLLENKVVLITGASRGIGVAVARLLANRGADVVINFRSKRARADEVANVVRSAGRMMSSTNWSNGYGVACAR